LEKVYKFWQVVFFMKAILDSSFIISCARNKIDFVSQLREQGFEIVVPNEVVSEMKSLMNKKTISRKNRDIVKLALDILDSSGVKYESFGGDVVDEMLVKLGKKGYAIGTLDRAIKKRISRRIVILTSKKRVSPDF